MSDYAINTVFGAKDRVTSVFGKMSSASKRFGDDATRSFRKASTGASSFKKIFGAILASNLVTSGLGAAQAGIAGMATQFLTFDDAITSASSKIDGFDRASKEGIDTLNQLKKVARDVGAATQFSATDAAKGLDFLVAAGFNAKQAMAALPGVVDLATNAKTDLAVATDIAADSLGAFGLMTTNTSQLQKNLTRVGDIFAKTMNMSTTGLEELYESAKNGGPVFTSMGQSMENFNAMAGILAGAGLKGADAGTQLKTIMLRLVNPTGAAAKQLKKLGVATKDQSGKFRDIIDIMSDLETGFKKYKSGDKGVLIDTIFGSYGISGVTAILSAGTGKLKEFRKGLYGADGAGRAMANTMRSSLLNRVKEISSALEELGLRFFTAFEKEGGSSIDSFSNAMRKVDISPLIETTKVLLKTFKILYNNGLSPLLRILPELTIGFLAFKTGMMIGGVINALKLGIDALRVSTISLNISMYANPVVIFAAALSSVAVAIYEIYKNWHILSQSGFFRDLLGWGSSLVGLESYTKGNINPFSVTWEEQNALSSNLATKNFRPNIGHKYPKNTSSIQPQIVPPNKTEIEARRSIDFNGKIEVVGAPQGSRATSTTKGAPPINIHMMGVNP